MFSESSEAEHLLEGTGTGLTSSPDTQHQGLPWGHHYAEELLLPHRIKNNPFGLPVPSAKPVNGTSHWKEKTFQRELTHRIIWNGQNSFLAQTVLAGKEEHAQRMQHLNLQIPVSNTVVCESLAQGHPAPTPPCEGSLLSSFAGDAPGGRRRHHECERAKAWHGRSQNLYHGGQGEHEYMYCVLYGMLPQHT